MKLGILSDTHGHLDRTRHALDILRNQKIDQLIHCGDVGSDLIHDQLFEQQEAGVPVTVVPGNVDEWEPGIPLYARKLGFPFHLTARLTLSSTRISVYHGHDPKLRDSLIADPETDIFLTGHTHVARDEQIGHVRVINPGAVYRAATPSVAVLDLGAGEKLDYFEL